MFFRLRLFLVVLRILSWAFLVLGVFGFLVDLNHGGAYTVLLFQTTSALFDAIVWLIVWVSLFALFMVLTYVAEYVEVIYRRVRELDLS